MAKVLIVEDDVDIAQVVGDVLRAENFMTDVAGTIADARHFLKVSSYDAIVLDWELPDGAGIDICKDIRMTGEPVPILMLTGRSATSDRIQGLDSGADDYLTKPFECIELIARIKSLLRRLWTKKSDSLVFGPLELEPLTRKVSLDGEEIKLLKKEFDVLELLMRSPSECFSTDALLEKLWGGDTTVGSDAVFQCIRRLRRKLDQRGAKSLIVQEHGHGYRLNSNLQ